MEYYGNKLCISYHELVESGIMTASNYKSLTYRKKMDVVRRGGGARGNCALIAIDSLPSKYRIRVYKAYPYGEDALVKEWIISNYHIDRDAISFFYDCDKTGFEMSDKKKWEYIVNASVLNCCIKLYGCARECQRLFGGKYSWGMMVKTIEMLRKELGHTLPTSISRFREKVNNYKRNGYGCLISGKFGNQSARKANI
ncbi:hypothetical protein [Hoylesella buccalis]|nr:hypothetical protein [Hoylesella buccalis]